MRLSQLIYVSQATNPMRRGELSRMVDQFRGHNEECRITGLLLYSGGHFIQLLEGYQTLLRTLFDRISRDSRHQNVQLLHFDLAVERLFPGWRMGFLNLDEITPLDRTGFLSIIDSAAKLPGGARILSLLKEFRNQLPEQAALRIAA